MCFTVNVNLVKEEIDDRFDGRLTDPDSYRPTYYYHAFAGLYDRWWTTPPPDGLVEYAFTIVTAPVHALMSTIHNSKKRMPVILGKKAEKEWLDPNTSFHPGYFFPGREEADFNADTISPLISKKGTEKNSPKLIRPYDYSEA